MTQPQYPTDEGIWSGGDRGESSFADVRLGTPYPEAVAHLRGAITGRDDFDPVSLFVWGTMQATGVLNILKDVEEAFGDEGQAVVRKGLKRAGREAMEGLIADSDFPEQMDEATTISYLVTGMNTVIYASLERPWIASGERAEFDILWCPHQDRYTAFDCRVQRYFVEGMIEAVDAAGYPAMTGWVESLIPGGADCCHFVIETRDETERNPWHIYSDQLGRRALDGMTGVDA
ncbi:MAG: hypothetical protein ACE5GC_00525 [Acidimicrobiia bacterium]